MLSTFFYALMNVCIKMVPSIPVMEVVLFRCIISLLFSYTHLRIIRQNPWGNNKPALFLRGLFGMLSLIFFFHSLQTIPLASAVTIQYMSPIFTIILATFIVKEKTRPFQYAFFFLSFIGVMLVKGLDSRIHVWDLIIGLMSAFFSGLAYNMIRKTSKSEHPMVVVFYFPLVALPFALVASLFNFVMPSGIEWLYLILTGIFTQLGQTFMTIALQEEQASGIVNLQYLGMLYSILFGYFLFGEFYSWLSIGGMLLIIAGILLNVFITRWLKKKEMLAISSHKKNQV